jgi:hypothetical protein
MVACCGTFGIMAERGWCCGDVYMYNRYQKLAVCVGSYLHCHLWRLVSVETGVLRLTVCRLVLWRCIHVIIIIISSASHDVLKFTVDWSGSLLVKPMGISTLPCALLDGIESDCSVAAMAAEWSSEGCLRLCIIFRTFLRANCWEASKRRHWNSRMNA